jgi:hypothetical protein
MSYYDYIRNIINNQAFVDTDSGIVFEFTAAQASQTYTKLPVITDNLGFNDVSAIAVYNIPSSVLNNLFYFQLDAPFDISNIDIINYGVNSNYTFSILFSTALLTYTAFNINAEIKSDYVTYLAYSLTGTTNQNIFANRFQLVQAVTNMDNSFNNIINQSIAYNGLNTNGPIYLSTDMSNPFAHSTKQLVSGMIDIANPVRKKKFYDDLAIQRENQGQYQIPNLYWVPFHSGDKMSILINYLSTYPGVQGRSYKIILNCVSNYTFPSSVSNIGLNLKGNLDPFYVLNLVNSASNRSFNLDASFVSIYNALQLPIYKEIGEIVNPLDLYYKTFLSNVTQPSLQNGNGLINNGINPSFQYIFLNSTITNILYPSLRTIKQSLITSPYNLYPTLNDIDDIQCDLNIALNNNIATNFIIRIYTRPVYNEIDNSLNPNDTFYGNYYDSKTMSSIGYNRYHLGDLFNSWTTMLNSSYNKSVYYFSGLQNLQTIGQQQILSICILTYDINANIGIKNIILTYK